MRSKAKSAFGGKNEQGKIRIVILIVIILVAVVGYFIWDYFSAEDSDNNGSNKTAKGCEVVDEDGWVGIDSNIAVDADNNPHISYYDQGNRDLKYSIKIGDSWQNETVDSEGDVGEESGIAVDQDGNPHISYIDVTGSAVKYAKKINDQWQIKTVDQTAGYWPVSTSIQLDSQGNSHIAYNLQSADDENGPVDNNKVEDTADDNQAGGYVKYASWNSSSWNIETVITGGQDVYLALDNNNNPHISFKKETNDENVKNSEEKSQLYYARQKSGDWEVEVVDANTQVGGDTGITVDSKGNPHISYLDYGNKAKKYAVWDDSVWQTKLVAQDGVNLEGIKIAVDNNDNPRIVYNDGKKENLMLAIFNGSLWDKKQLDTMGNPSITVDSLNRSHLSYSHTAEDKNNQFTDIMKQTGEKEIEILKYCLIYH